MGKISNLDKEILKGVMHSLINQDESEGMPNG